MFNFLARLGFFFFENEPKKTVLEIELASRADIFQILMLLQKEVILLYVGARMKNAKKK